MRISFRTVRGKLMALVALPIALVCVVLPVIATLMHDELIDEADDRLDEADRSFQTELDDDLADLTVTLRVLVADPETQRALTQRDPREALALAQVFAGVYPHIDVIFADADGNVLADVGPSTAPHRLDEVPDLRNIPREGEFHAISRDGCSALSAHAPPSRVIAAAAGTGLVVVCEPFDHQYVRNAGTKLGLELALLDGTNGDELAGTTLHFPHGADHRAVARPTLYELDGRTWAIVRVSPRLVAGARGGRVNMVAAMDVTDIRRIVRKHFLLAFGLVALVALFSIAMGGRVARIMSRALAQVIGAFRKLEQQEYVHVAPVGTRDELEALATGFNSMVEGLKERDNLRTTFGKYMTESVMEHLLSGKVKLGGETLNVTILFSDIRSFTSISEKMDAHALVALLNEYFTEMVSIVMRHNGVVDKYIGDAIMAVFGAPVPTPDDAKNAVRAAVEMRHALVALNERLAKRGVPELRTGIGIHTGDVVAGNIGSEQRMEYTVIGDTVNLASRLESNTKDLNVDVLISAVTYEATKDIIEARPVKEIHVKGREQAVMTYEVTGIKGE